MDFEPLRYRQRRRPPSQSFAPQPDGEPKRQSKQRQKSSWGFQLKKNREVEPHAVRICVSQNECGPAFSHQNQQHASQVKPWGHQQSSQEQEGESVAVPNAIEGIRRLMQRKNKIEDVDNYRSPKDSPQRCSPASSPPCARLRFRA